jgi:hypothetical protein
MLPCWYTFLSPHISTGYVLFLFEVLLNLFITLRTYALVTTLHPHSEPHAGQEVSDRKLLAFDLATRGGADHWHQMLAASTAHLVYSGKLHSQNK